MTQKKGRPKVGEVLQVRIPPQLLAKAQKAAEENGFTVSEYVRALIFADTKGKKR